jgi:hypothetical protein
VVSSLCEAYHWTLAEAMKLTMPQIIMLNHASWVNRENAERRYNAKSKKKNVGLGEQVWQQEQEKVENMEPAQLSTYLSTIF